MHRRRSSGVAAVVLAAGAGSRFGGGKLLAMLDGAPLLEHVLGALEGAPVDETVVVVGADAEKLREVCEPYGVRIVENPDWAKGQSTSVRAGLGAVAPEARAAIVLLGDQPLVGAGAVERRVRALGGARTSRWRPTAGGGAIRYSSRGASGCCSWRSSRGTRGRGDSCGGIRIWSWRCRATGWPTPRTWTRRRIWRRCGV